MYDNLDIITIGESLIELSSSTSLMCSNSFNKYYGGDTLVSAIAALRLGSKVGYITKVGNDGFGEYLLDAWQSEGLDSSQVKLTQGQNGIYFLAESDGKIETQYYRKKTAASTLCIDDINFEYIKSAKLVYATGFVQSLSLSTAEVIKEVFKFAKENDILVAYDPDTQGLDIAKDEILEAFNSISEYVDIMLLSTKDGTIFDTNSPCNLITKLSDLAIQTIVIKDWQGKKLYIYENNDTIHIPFLECDIIDSTGATSAFNGAFLSELLKGQPAQNAAKFASAMGALQVQKVGAVKSIPQRDKTEEYYRQYYG